MTRYKLKNFLISLFTQLIIVIPLLVLMLTQYEDRNSPKESQKIHNIQKVPVQSMDENILEPDLSEENNILLIMEEPLGDNEKLLWMKKIPTGKKAKPQTNKNKTDIVPATSDKKEVALSDI